MSGCKASEILRNAAYREVRRSASGPEGRGMRVTQPFDFAQGRELVERQMGVFRQPLFSLYLEPLFYYSSILTHRSFVARL
jgi:hypothetical protein